MPFITYTIITETLSLSSGQALRSGTLPFIHNWYPHDCRVFHLAHSNIYSRSLQLNFSTDIFNFSPNHYLYIIIYYLSIYFLTLICCASQKWSIRPFLSTTLSFRNFCIFFSLGVSAKVQAVHLY